MRSIRPIVFAVLLSIVFASSGVSAAEAGSGASPASRLSGDVLQQLWSALAHLWSPTPTTDAGCIMDPLGRCREATLTADEGCIIDPLGRCAAGR
jgi:hypothetical protein